MKVAIISKSDRIGGGASRVAEDQAIWLNEAGYQSDHFIAFSHQDSLPFQQSLYGNHLGVSLCKTIHGMTNRLGFRELLPAEYWFNLNHLLDDYDIIHFHDLYSAISPLTLALTARRKPTFFTVHDCSAFTGGCLYPMGCEKFSSFCHQCPQLPQNTWKNRLRDRTKEIQTIKRVLAKNSPIGYIFPSHWIAQQASLCLQFKVPPVVIPYGIDLQPYSAVSKQEAKAKLNIPTERQVIAISSHYLHDPRKGVKYAISALQSVSDLAPIVLAVGHGNDELTKALEGLEVKETGFISDRNFLAQVYAASDIMLFCTLADNLPLTILEAMAASTPVIGFATGGVPEMIQTGRNGILVEPAHQEALNQALHQALNANNLAEMGQQARKDVEHNFSKTLFLERHLKLYQSSELTCSSSEQQPICPGNEAFSSNQ